MNLSFLGSNFFVCIIKRKDCGLFLHGPYPSDVYQLFRNRRHVNETSREKKGIVKSQVGWENSPETCTLPYVKQILHM